MQNEKLINGVHMDPIDTDRVKQLASQYHRHWLWSTLVLSHFYLSQRSVMSSGHLSLPTKA